MILKIAISERLSVDNPSEAHLLAVHAMPRLRRLRVWGDEVLLAQPPELPALPPGHAGLQWLRVYNLPRATTQSLLRAHGGHFIHYYGPYMVQQFCPDPVS